MYGSPAAWAAHPHVRGEDGTIPVMARDITGSPPRAWGGQALHGLGNRRVRLTPTCVGRTLLDLWKDPVDRLTPTCVGRTHPGAVGQSSPAAHPHVRGEDAVLANAEVAPLGSPPRAWGGPPRRDCLDAELRLTPTCVGRTSGPPSGPATRTAHPHVRGEDRAKIRHGWSTFGSPPRAWGGPPSISHMRALDRLTPTCVGRTRSATTTAPPTPAHPHVRGEDSAPGRRSSETTGSPPRAWGGHKSRHIILIRVRLTPTCVGRTVPPWFRRGCRTAHPHVRGEDS